MRIYNNWHNWRKHGFVTLATKNTETNLMFHPVEWATPYISFTFSKYDFLFNFTILCFSVMFSYNKYDSGAYDELIK